MHEHKAEGGREGGRKRPLLEAEAMADPLKGSGKRSGKVMKGIRLGRSLVNHTSAMAASETPLAFLVVIPRDRVSLYKPSWPQSYVVLA